MEIYWKSSLNSKAIPMDNQWGQLLIQLKHELYTNGNFKDIPIEIIGNPVEISMEYQ